MNVHSEETSLRTYRTKHGTIATMQTANIGAPSSDPPPAANDAERPPSEVRKAHLDTIAPVPDTSLPENISIHNEDILTTDRISRDSVDLIITSPPYNVGIEYGEHDDTTDYESYLSFTEQWLEKCYSLVKPDGRLCLNIPLDKNAGGQQSVYADIMTIAKATGWKYHTTIIWNEQNISRRTAWGSWRSASAPYLIAPVETIVVLYKEVWKKQTASGAGESDITSTEFLNWTNGVWSFNGESSAYHPAPFPIELPRRCIKLFSYVDDAILDPFCGSGTTLLACHETGRKGIGIEIDPSYCNLTRHRLSELTAPDKPLFTVEEAPLCEGINRVNETEEQPAKHECQHSDE